MGEAWKRYATAEAWSRELGLPAGVLRQRLDGAASRTGRGRDGVAVACYAEADVRAACADLLPAAPRAAAG